ncbi:MAG: hypothetical protein V3V78_01295, partial [Candidatus Woesearchaeota archaeon]
MTLCEIVKLKKEEFDKKYRFRRARPDITRESKNQVNCASCDTMSGGTTDEEPALCDNDERLRIVKIAQYLRDGWGGKGDSRNISLNRVCDAYTNKSLPEGVEIPVLPENHAILLASQWR